MVFFILINCDNYSDEIAKDISKVLSKGIKHHFESVYGVYDGVLKIEQSFNDGETKIGAREIAEKIRSLPKIHSTMVLTVSD